MKVNIYGNVIILIVLIGLSSCIFNQGNNNVVASNYKDIDSELYESDMSDFELNNAGVKTIRVPQNLSNENTMPLLFSTVFDSVAYLKLESTPQALLAQVDQMQIVDSIILLLDTRAAKSLKAFNINGRYLYSYGRTGRAKGEYIEPTSFSVFDNKIEIYDQFQGKMLEFGLGGQFIREKRVPFIFRNFKHTGANSYVFHCFNEDNHHLSKILDYLLVETDSNFVIKHRGLFRHYNKYARIGSAGLAYVNNQTYVYVPYTSDTVYMLKSDSCIEAIYHIDYGSRKLGVDLLAYDKFNEALDAINTDKRYINPQGTPIVLNDHVYFNSTIQGVKYSCIYDKKTEAVRAYNSTTDNVTLCFASVNFLYAQNNNLIGTVESGDVFRMMAEFHKSRKQYASPELDTLIEKNKALIQDMSSIQENDNLILVFARIKNY